MEPIWRQIEITQRSEAGKGLTCTVEAPEQRWSQINGYDTFRTISCVNIARGSAQPATWNDIHLGCESMRGMCRVRWPARKDKFE